MKVLVIFHHFLPYHYARLQSLASKLYSFGGELSALEIMSFDENFPTQNQCGEFSFCADSLCSSPAGFKFKNLNKELRVYLNRVNPDVLFLPSWGERYSRVALRWATENQRKSVLMCESKFDDKPRFNFIEKLKSFLFVKHFTAALVGSDLHKEYLIGLGIPKDVVFFGYDVVDNDYFKETTKSLRLKNEGKKEVLHEQGVPDYAYFLTVSRFEKRKNIEGLIKAYYRYYLRVGSSANHLVICGAGERVKEIKKLVSRLNLGSYVHLLGFLNYESIAKMYAFAEALIHPAFVEQWGLVINEACASGLPVLCSQTVGARYDLVLNKKNGFLFDPTSIDDIAEKMFLFSECSDEMKYQMGEESRRLVQSFDSQYFGDGAMKCLKKVMEVRHSKNA